MASTGAALEAATAAMTTAQAAEAEAQQQASLMTRLTQALAELSAHEDTRPDHERRAGVLAAARHAEPVRPLVAALNEAEAEVTEARERLARPGCRPG